MKITTLVENTTISSKYRSKHGLCFYIETLKHKILFDLGPNKLFLENAMRMNIDISTIDTVIISHGHKDHGGAMNLFFENNSNAKIYIRENAFLPYYTKIFNIPVFVGLDSSLYGNKQIILTGERIIIDEELQLFSGITERVCYSTSNSVLYAKNDRSYLQDTFAHEQNLIITENLKTVLIAGCAHNGIVNIQKKSRKYNRRQIDIRYFRLSLI
jgi:7,8-dihydropterin-6-yl-methyl-4-(beta-D-ribofuranosyl)aminobenzene 5'-phosphate synthase